jgi:SAM-dependent methyltransferase
MYNNFSNDYDRFVNWRNRLAMELPFLEEKITLTFPSQSSPIRVLDAAAGTGMHAIALSKLRFDVSGSDLSEGMIQRARENARAEKVDLQFEVAGFGKLADAFGIRPSSDPSEHRNKFDAVLCLGNSLPHVTNTLDLQETLLDFSNCLNANGLLILQNRNFDAVMASKERWMEPQFYKERNKEWLFLRFYDYRPDGLINFNIVTLVREGNSDWSQKTSETLLLPLLSQDLKSELIKAGFVDIKFYGDMTGKQYSPAGSGNLVVTARKTG